MPRREYSNEETLRPTVEQAPLIDQVPLNPVISEPVELVDNPVSLKQASTGIPIHLKILKIGVDAKIESVGLTDNGVVGTTKGPTNVTWYNLGPRPGDEGSAVITGHYGRWKNGQGSVFDNLSKLVSGDKIVVEDGDGNAVSFVVREMHRYGKNENAPEVFSSSDGKAHLNLITCDGVWIETQKTYSERLVVFADRES
jgi:LPXTG-site transpeptidase (sortase) family protein